MEPEYMEPEYMEPEYMEPEYMEEEYMGTERAIEIASTLIKREIDCSEYDYVSDVLRSLDITEDELHQLGLDDYLSSMDLFYSSISFRNDGRDDETQFDTEIIGEVLSLWEDFAKENDIPADSITGIEMNMSGSVYARDDECTYGGFILKCIEGERIRAEKMDAKHDKAKRR